MIPVLQGDVAALVQQDADMLSLIGLISKYVCIVDDIYDAYILLCYGNVICYLYCIYAWGS